MEFAYPETFPWGPVVATHRIGPHIIVEHHPEIFKGCCGTGKHDYDKTVFSVITKEERSHGPSYHGASTLDGALIISICQRREKLGAAPWVAKLIEIESV